MSALATTGDFRMYLKQAVAEVRRDILAVDNSPQDEAWLWHQLGSLYGQLGNMEKQREAWEKAKELDPESDMITASLESLSI